MSYELFTKKESLTTKITNQVKKIITFSIIFSLMFIISIAWNDTLE